MTKHFEAWTFHKISSSDRRICLPSLPVLSSPTALVTSGQSRHETTARLTVWLHRRTPRTRPPFASPPLPGLPPTFTPTLTLPSLLSLSLSLFSRVLILFSGVCCVCESMKHDCCTPGDVPRGRGGSRRGPRHRAQHRGILVLQLRGGGRFPWVVPLLGELLVLRLKPDREDGLLLAWSKYCWRFRPYGLDLNSGPGRTDKMRC